MFGELVSNPERFQPPLQPTVEKILYGQVELLVSNATVGDGELLNVLQRAVGALSRLPDERLFQSLSGLAAILSVIHRCSVQLSGFLVRTLWDNVREALSRSSVVSAGSVRVLYSEITLLGWLVHERVVDPFSILVLWHLLFNYYSRSWYDPGYLSNEDGQCAVEDWALHAAIDIAFITGHVLAEGKAGSPLYSGLCLFRDRLRQALWEGVFSNHSHSQRIAKFPSKLTLAERVLTLVDALDRVGPAVLRRRVAQALMHWPSAPQIELDLCSVPVASRRDNSDLPRSNRGRKS